MVGGWNRWWFWAERERERERWRPHTHELSEPFSVTEAGLEWDSDDSKEATQTSGVKTEHGCAQGVHLRPPAPADEPGQPVQVQAHTRRLPRTRASTTRAQPSLMDEFFGGPPNNKKQKASTPPATPIKPAQEKASPPSSGYNTRRSRQALDMKVKSSRDGVEATFTFTAY